MPSRSIVRAGIFAIAASTVNAAPAASSCSAPGANIISNPGFESSKTSYSPWTSTQGESADFKVVQPGESSNNALSIADDLSTAHSEATISQSVTTKCSTEHLFSFDYKFSQAGTKENGMVASALNSNYGIDPYVQSNTTWTTFSEYSSITFGPEYSVSVQLFPNNANSGDGNKILLDNFKLFPAGSPVVKSGATNKVTNGGFESGKLGPWKQYSGESNIHVVSPGLNGSKYAAKVSTSLYDSVLEQNVTTTKGSHYLFTFDYSYPKAPTDNSSLLLTFDTNGGRQDSLTGAVSGYYGTDIAQKGQNSFERRIVAHGDKTLLTLGFNYGMPKPDNIGPITIDNISLKEIEVPKMA